MPNDFPKSLYEDVYYFCQQKMKSNRAFYAKWQEFGAAWRAIAYRFRGLVDHDQAFSSALMIKGHEGRYIQERELFNFFVAGLSIFETFAYGVYFIGSIHNSKEFKTDHHSAITLNELKKRLDKVFPESELTGNLSQLLNDESFIQWKEIRNVLAHRGAPSRVINLSIGSGPEKSNDLWKIDNIPLNPETTSLRRLWLSRWLEKLLKGAKEFANDVI